MSDPDYHPVDVFVGKKLKARRQLADLTQEALGAALGLTYQQIQKYERGVTRIALSRLVEIAEYLHVPPEYFIEGATTGRKRRPSREGAIAQAAAEALDTAEGQRLLRAFGKLKEKRQREKLAAIFEMLVEAMAPDQDPDLS